MTAQRSKARLRCAIYTRVSSDIGLEQDFNSLDNQREAAVAYVKSQAHEAGFCSATVMTTAGFPAARWSGRRSRSCSRMSAKAGST